MNKIKESQYHKLSQQLETLHKNLEISANQLEIMSNQCNDDLVNKLGRIQSSWFMGSNRTFERRMLNK